MSALYQILRNMRAKSPTGKYWISQGLFDRIKLEFHIDLHIDGSFQINSLPFKEMKLALNSKFVGPDAWGVIDE